MAATSLTRLNLSANKIGPQGAIALGLTLPQTKLSFLRLHANKIGSAGAQALVQAMAGSVVTALNLELNNMDDQGAIALSQAVSQTHLVDVVLDFFNATLAQTLRANHQKLTFIPYYALRLSYLSEELKAPFYPRPALSSHPTTQEQLHYAAGILVEANEDVQYHILSFLPLMNARKIKALKLRTAAKGGISEGLPEEMPIAKQPSPQEV